MAQITITAIGAGRAAAAEANAAIERIEREQVRAKILANVLAAQATPDAAPPPSSPVGRAVSLRYLLDFKAKHSGGSFTVRRSYLRNCARVCAVCDRMQLRV